MKSFMTCPLFDVLIKALCGLKLTQKRSILVQKKIFKPYVNDDLQTDLINTKDLINTLNTKNNINISKHT